jgi:hypothetical protein
MGDDKTLLAQNDTVRKALVSITEQIRLLAVAELNGVPADLAATAALLAQKELYELELQELANRIGESYKR